MKALAFDYTSSKSAWMTAEIFEQCFKNQFVPSMTKHLCSLKLPDNCQHRSDEVQSIYTGEVDQFRGALAADGITVSTDDINDWLD